MIRRLLTLIVFTGTVLLAAFGQHVFGRSDIDHWAHKIHQDAPQHIQLALRETDKALTQLSPEAGGAPVCWMNDIDLKHISLSHTGV